MKRGAVTKFTTILPDQYRSKESLKEKYSNLLRVAFYRYITKHALPLFLKADDVISSSPSSLGVYEKRIIDLIRYLVTNYSKIVLIDIGANVGLISCQTGQLFNKVYCFEPNPICFKILEANTKICLDSSATYLYNFGLGPTDGNVTLKFPKHNWGGAFIDNPGNSYTASELLSKDGADNYENYLSASVEIKNADEVLSQILNSITADENGIAIIKMDVEGYEISILKSFARSCPKGIKIFVIFEYHSRSIFNESLNTVFSNNTRLYQLVRTPEKRESNLVRFTKIASKLGYIYKLKPAEPTCTSTDFVLEIN